METNTRKKIYISAPISGHDIEERKLFFLQIEKQLVEQGGIPVNPFRNALPDSATYTEHIRQDLMMLLECDGIVRPDRWRMSKGCEIESRVADICGIPVVGIIGEKGDLQMF